MVRKLIGAVVLAIFLIGAVFARAGADGPITRTPLPAAVWTAH